MSRAALWKQQGKVQEREARAQELFENALHEGQQRPGVEPLWGPDDGTFHWNSILLQNTIHNSYFQTCCETLTSWNSIIDEIYEQVNHLQPFMDPVNKTPSTAFCLLLRLLLLRMTSHQLQRTISHEDSPYIRGIGFLYVRYACLPERVYPYIAPYLQDEQEFTIESNTKKQTTTPITMGEYVRTLFGNHTTTKRDYYGTPLPRYPIHIERDLMVYILHHERIHQRAQQHFKNSTVKNQFVVGARIMALYGDDENPVEWYEAVIDRVLTKDESTGCALKYPKFIVTFTEYGNTETVTLGEIDLVDGTSWRNDRRPGGGEDRRVNHHHHHHRGGGSVTGRGNDSRHRYDAKDDDLYEEIRRREQEGVATSHRSDWAKRPPTTKSALSTKSQHAVRDDDDGEVDVHRRRHHQHRQHPHCPSSPPSSQPPPPAAAAAPSSSSLTGREPPPRKRTAQEVAAMEDKKRRLLAKYG